MNRQNLNEIMELVAPIVGGLGYECLDVEWVGDERTLRVYINQTNGITLDDCLVVNKPLADNEALDNLINGPYQLEISSPGIEKPLRLSAHFKEALGQTVRVKLVDDAVERRRGVGKIVNVSDDDCVTLETGEGIWTFPLTQLESARLVYDWSKES